MLRWRTRSSARLVRSPVVDDSVFILLVKSKSSIMCDRLQNHFWLWSTWKPSETLAYSLRANKSGCYYHDVRVYWWLVILVGGLRFYPDSIFFFLSFFRSLPSELPERNSTTSSQPATSSAVSAIWKCISEIWLYPTPTNRGPKHLVSTTS